MKKILITFFLTAFIVACGVYGAPSFPPGSTYPGNYPAE